MTPHTPASSQREKTRRPGRLSSVLLQVTFVVVGVSAVYWLQTRNLLAADGQVAPPLVLSAIDGRTIDLRESAGTPTLVYFFAPWCHVCAASAHNLRATHRSRGDDLSILLVALDWKTEDEVREYAQNHRLDVPVLLGSRKTAQDWNIFGFPTYYVVDSRSRIARKDFGYSSQFGLWWRTRFTR